MGLRKVGAYLFQCEWSGGYKFGRRPPQGVHGARWPGRSGAARGCRCHFVSVAGRFTVVLVKPLVRPVDLTPPKFPGYPANSSSCQVCPPNQLSNQVLSTRWKIHVLDWTKNRQPITRSKLAYEVAKQVQRYLNQCITVRSCFDVINFATTHHRRLEIYFGWIRRGAVEGR